MSKVKLKFESQEALEAADRLHSAAIHLLRFVRLQDTKSGVGPARLSALSVLVFGGSMTLGQLANAEQVKPPTMTRIVKGLEQGGLAERVNVPSDARQIQIRATAKGARLLQAARKRRIRSLAQLLGSIDPESLRLLQQSARLLENALRGSRGD